MSPYRDSPPHSNPDLQDYYDTIPPAHRFSSLGDSRSSYHSSQDIPLSNQRPAYNSVNTESRGVYTQPLATDSATDIPIMPQYTNFETNETRWMEKPPRKSRRSKLIVIGSLVVVIGLIVVGVAVGIVVSKQKKGGSGSSSSVVSQTDPNDPSTFVKNPALVHSFYGIAYTPEGSQLPECGNSLDQVITDIQLLSQLTSRIRVYGADCNQSALVLEAIKQTKVNMTVYLANYALASDSGVAYTRQRNEIMSAIQTYGADHISGVTVGNEFMLDYLDANGATDPNSAVGNTGAAILIADIKDTRSALANLSLSKTIPVGTADAGSYFNNMVLQAVDYGMANVHPWFANVSISQAADWTAEFFQTTDVQAAAALSNNPVMTIAETGWPTQSSDASNESNGPSVASEANLQTFLDTFVCQANTNGTGYFFFEYFDEPWKDVQFGGVEGWWGLFHSNRTLKNINIPNCTIS